MQTRPDPRDPGSECRSGRIVAVFLADGERMPRAVVEQGHGELFWDELMFLGLAIE